MSSIRLGNYISVITLSPRILQNIKLLLVNCRLIYIICNQSNESTASSEIKKRQNNVMNFVMNNVVKYVYIYYIYINYKYIII